GRGVGGRRIRLGRRGPRARRIGPGGRAGRGAGHTTGRIGPLLVVDALGGRPLDHNLLLDRLLLSLRSRDRVARVGQVVVGQARLLLLGGAGRARVEGALRVRSAGGQRQNHQDGKYQTLRHEFSSPILSVLLGSLFAEARAGLLSVKQ